MLLMIFSSAFAGTPHIVTGKIFNHDMSVPANGSITFIAFITSRPGEIQTQGSTGNGYSDGYWYIGIGNFPTAWSVGNVLHVDFTNTITKTKNSINYTLTSSDPDMTPDVTLSAQVTNTTHGGSFGTIQAAINAAVGDNDIITVDGSTYNATEAIIVNKQVTVLGVTSTPTITPPFGVGITVTVNGVTLDNLKVYHAPSNGIWASGVSNLTIINVVADANGVSVTASGIALQAITGTSLTNVTATNNTGNGLEIVGGVGVQVVGGTYSNNGH